MKVFIAGARTIKSFDKAVLDELLAVCFVLILWHAPPLG